MSADNGTMLMVSNATGEALNYQAFIAEDEFGKGTRTSVCTLMAGPLAIEHWPQRLPGVRITNFEPAGGTMGCR
jgi:hypothetical protein